MVLIRQPCVQAFTRLVKVWKPDCGYTRNWCVGYERRTQYYTTYKERYEPTQVTRYKCCSGWQMDTQGTACNNRICSESMCHNGGQCNGGYTSSCSCRPGYQGARCQYGFVSPLTLGLSVLSRAGWGPPDKQTSSATF
ncbi:multiple epidermal growth factor-like domains protein 6 [Physella acuta]|uniref:multiple epidermal growth factor-like domains protein 6 n=1 Tax=Physella acuta TaxID=109671 RepID=UPI0027DCFEA4|nr:multiple epidermal growth factor-like domains protein 6 [Physella acuta]